MHVKYESLLLKFYWCICSLWSGNQLPASAEIFEMLLSDVVHNESAIRQAAARALSVALDTHRSHVAEILQKLLDIYRKKLEASLFSFVLFS